MTDEADDAWPPKELLEWARHQAGSIRDTAREGGLRFQAYLPAELALWLLDRIEQGMFIDPSEAVFVLLDESRELETHADLRHELLKRKIQRAMDDPEPSVPAHEVLERLEDMRARARPAPALWLPKSDD